MPRLLLVEDDIQIARPLSHELSRRGYDLEVAHTAEQALAALRVRPPCLVLLDLGLPDRDGVVVLTELRSNGSALPVIVLTARDDSGDRVDQLQAGADDYVVKPFDVAELDARIAAVLRRTGKGGAQGIAVGSLRLLADGVRVVLGETPIALTPRELQVLRHLLRHADRVVSKPRLLETLAEFNDDLAEKSIEVYIHRLRQKIAGHDVEIVTLRGFGYLLRRLPHA